MNIYQKQWQTWKDHEAEDFHRVKQFRYFVHRRDQHRLSSKASWKSSIIHIDHFPTFLKMHDVPYEWAFRIQYKQSNRTTLSSLPGGNALDINNSIVDFRISSILSQFDFFSRSIDEFEEAERRDKNIGQNIRTDLMNGNWQNFRENCSVQWNEQNSRRWMTSFLQKTGLHRQTEETYPFDFCSMRKERKVLLFWVQNDRGWPFTAVLFLGMRIDQKF